jgi:CrcB protein
MKKLGFYAALGAALGSAARYQIGEQIDSTYFPWATFLVNVVGSFLIGFLIGLPFITNSDQRRVFLVTGVLGGFTTFSAVAVEALNLPANLALIYLFSSFAVGLIAALLAFQLSRRIK